MRLLLSFAAGASMVITIVLVQKALEQAPDDILTGVIGALSVLLVWFLTARTGPRPSSLD